MDNKQIYEEKLQAQIKEWQAKIDLLTARGEKAGADARLKIQKEVEMLKSKLKAAQGKLAEVREAGEEMWESIKDSAEETWDDVKSAFNKVISRQGDTDKR